MNVSGPVFLLLYFIVALAVNIWLRSHFRRSETRELGRTLNFAHDPYRIAFLRGGAAEAIKVAVVSLVDRGLLEEHKGNLRTRRKDASEIACRPIEKAILDCFSSWRDRSVAAYNTRVEAACHSYETELKEERLLADAQIYSDRLTAFALTAMVMLAISAWRISNSLAHGKSNIGFLVILTLICLISLTIAYRNRMTGAGKAALDRLKLLFASLKRRASSVRAGGENQDAALLAALFGLAILPAEQFPYVTRLYPRPSSSDSGGDGGSGSDGGGGCGGGCGGCGGGCG
jgi:uncharacterized protein (TIGR04222 family)